MSLDKHQKQLLVSGYIRSNSPHIPRRNTTILHEQCYSFYEEVLDWCITGETLHQLIHTTCRQPIVSPVIQYHEIRFNYKIYSNEDNRIAILFQLCSKPKDILEISAFCTIYLENELISQQSVIFNLDRPSHPLTSSCVISDYIHRESLTFSMHLEILNVKYHQAHQDERLATDKWMDYHSKYFKTITVNQYSKYEWKLDDFILRTIRDTNNKRFYLEDVKQDSIWTMSVQCTSSECNLHIHLIKLPFYIDTMNIRCKLTVKYEDSGREFTTVMSIQNVGFNHIQNISYRHAKDWTNIKKSISALAFVWEVFVLQTVDFNGNILFNDDKQQCRFINQIVNC
eukprot:490333_1